MKQKEHQKGLAKKLRFARIWWLPFLLLMLVLAITGYAIEDDASRVLWVMVACFVSAIALFCGLYAPRTPKLVERLGDSNSLIRQQTFERILRMPREQAISYFVQALTTPFPVFTLPSAHSLAAEGLGVLKAREAIPVLVETLKHPNKTVRAKAIWALGEIGDSSVAPHLIPLLGEGSVHAPLFKSQTQIISDYAAYALQKLGEGDLVTAFKEALSGRLSEKAKQQLKGKYRPQVVQAFVKALDGNALTAIGAAWALGELLLVEALPALQRKARSPLTPSEVRKACREAIAKLRPFAYLPAIPSVSPETMNLPRPAVPTEISMENLPRAASFEQANEASGSMEIPSENS